MQLNISKASDDDYEQSFAIALQELRQVRPQIIRGAEYCEQQYLERSNKSAVVENCKTYAVGALNNVVEHISNVAKRFEILTKTQLLQLERTAVDLASVTERVQGSQEYLHAGALKQLQGTYVTSQSLDYYVRGKPPDDDGMPRNVFERIGRAGSRLAREDFNLQYLSQSHELCAFIQPGPPPEILADQLVDLDTFLDTGRSFIMEADIQDISQLRESGQFPPGTFSHARLPQGGPPSVSSVMTVDKAAYNYLPPSPPGPPPEDTTVPSFLQPTLGAYPYYPGVYSPIKGSLDWAMTPLSEGDEVTAGGGVEEEVKEESKTEEDAEDKEGDAADDESEKKPPPSPSLARLTRSQSLIDHAKKMDQENVIWDSPGGSPSAKGKRANWANLNTCSLAMQEPEEPERPTDSAPQDGEEGDQSGPPLARQAAEEFLPEHEAQKIHEHG
ncbi:hypothetical protein CYMTET_51333 [Cymbomonas tetramitiformis]|uniref:Uncharacterized protein n=1 Tax=Cymbomonas tetramitiformis TaxID=36881 RepID=A0AAE0BN19_9CHLO|nr:hypothetical protein CYMTET_51333 [Cymbomonas tetramitiformis]